MLGASQAHMWSSASTIDASTRRSHKAWTPPRLAKTEDWTSHATSALSWRPPCSTTHLHTFTHYRPAKVHVT